MNVQETTCAMRSLPHPPPLRTNVKRYVTVTCNMAQCCQCFRCCGFPSEKLAKVRNNSQLLSEFDCCYLVLRYRRFLKANFNVQFDDQLEFYNVTV